MIVNNYDVYNRMGNRYKTIIKG